ncbi:MAG: hypothetical protein LBK47_07985 [Prevotellaceae bacterium]|jgi:hypothetical protein|nr:hypothetical protein [Prevotellaceae bacterium]
MKNSYLLTVLTALLLGLAACTTEDYYRNANLSPVLTANVDLDRIDTIKTGMASQARTFTMSVTATDENKNMNTLLVSASAGNVKIDGEATNSVPIEATRERGDFTRSIEFVPNSEGLHTLNARVRDDFGTSGSIEKKVFSFTNMRPKVGVTSTAPHRTNLDEVEYPLDFSTSYDRDAKWGGRIDSLCFLAYSKNYVDDTGDEEGAWTYFHFATNRGYPFFKPSEHENIINMYLYDDGNNWYTDMWCWIKDNEGAVSDTVHYSIGHVE